MYQPNEGQTNDNVNPKDSFTDPKGPVTDPKGPSTNIMTEGKAHFCINVN